MAARRRHSFGSAPRCILASEITPLYEHVSASGWQTTGPWGGCTAHLSPMQASSDLIWLLDARGGGQGASADLHRQLASSLQRLGSNVDAVAALTRAAALKPGDASVLASAASVLQQWGDTPSAVAAVSRALCNAPREPGVHGTAAGLWYALGWPSLALRCLPHDATAWAGAASTRVAALASLGRYPEALRAATGGGTGPGPGATLTYKREAIAAVACVPHGSGPLIRGRRRPLLQSSSHCVPAAAPCCSSRGRRCAWTRWWTQLCERYVGCREGKRGRVCVPTPVRQHQDAHHIVCLPTSHSSSPLTIGVGPGIPPSSGCGALVDAAAGPPVLPQRRAPCGHLLSPLARAGPRR